MILIDEPRWHAHGTVWAHVVSDSSLSELHGFARRVGLPKRSFDLDHYDAPAARHAELIGAGAVAVPRRELITRLNSSGLRVPGHARQAAKRDLLASRWDHLLPQHSHIGAELLDRWHEPHRIYHGPAHLRHALDSHALLLQLSPISQPRPQPQPQPSIVVENLALWFHDAIYTTAGSPPGTDETLSAQLAVDLLGPTVSSNGDLTAPQVDEVARLVLITQEHNPRPEDEAGARVNDADLAVLGSAPDRYARYTKQVRTEFRDIPDERFSQGRATILTKLLRQGTLFRTPAAANRWEQQAQHNLRTELAHLTVKKPRSAN